MNHHLALPPFGSAISACTWSDTSRQYRYGCNGKEKDFETANDDFPKAIVIGARIYDGRLGQQTKNNYLNSADHDKIEENKASGKTEQQKASSSNSPSQTGTN